MPVELETIKKFMELYRGRDDAWGAVDGMCMKEPVTEESYRTHLEGKKSLGIYPLLPDGTCWFFDIDIDEPKFQESAEIRKATFEKALKIRQVFAEMGIPVYVSRSKSKGFHISGFAGGEPFVAGDIRRLCHAVAEKAGVNPVEVFPKQDKLDDATQYGNYINLPCFGDTRTYVNANGETVPTSGAVMVIKRVHPDDVVRQVNKLPKTVQPITEEPKEKREKKKGGKQKHPPCIENLLRGVGQGARDVAAFAIARHYLDQQYTVPEVIGLLMAWDAANKPPIGDNRILEQKATSASKGYFFGCASITGEPLLEQYCVGMDNCVWIKAENLARKKRGVLLETSFHESDTHLYEEVYKSGQAGFICYEKSTGNITSVPQIDYPNVSIVPCKGAEIPEGAVTLPEGVMEYGDTLALHKEVKDHVYRYVDLSERDLEFSCWYIMMSWIHDRLNTVSFLRFLGDTGVGKSRALDAIGRLCFKPMMMAGAVTPAPIYRLIRRYRGTLILEEADLRESDEMNEVIKILNCGIERGRPVIRCNKDDPDSLEILPCFGTKVFASRHEFQDVALESRCIPIQMEETSREDIPIILGKAFQNKATELRQKLLLWRLRNYTNTSSEQIENVDIGQHLEPRLKQMALPFVICFKDYPDVMEHFRAFLKKAQEDLIRSRGDSRDGLVLTALFRLALKEGPEYITSTAIATYCKDELKLDINYRRVGSVLRTMKITTSNRRHGLERARFVDWDIDLMTKLIKRYATEPEEFKDLLERPKEKPDMEF